MRFYIFDKNIIFSIIQLYVKYSFSIQKNSITKDKSNKMIYSLNIIYINEILIYK